MPEKQRVKCLQHVCSAHLGRDSNAQCFTSVFINHSEHFVLAAIAQFVMNKVYAPGVVWVFGAQADNRAVLVIKTVALPMTLRQLQPFLAPQSLDLLVIDLPTLNAQEFSDLVIAITAILLG